MAFAYDAHNLQRLTPANRNSDLFPHWVSPFNQAGFDEDTATFFAPHVAFQNMGDVKYERGVVCATLQRMQANASGLVTATTTLTAKIPDYPPCDGIRAAYPDGKTVDAFVIARQENLDDVLNLVGKLGDNNYEYCTLRIKDMTGAYEGAFKGELAQLNGVENETPTVGWLDIHNDFMVFTDKPMYDFFRKDVFELTP